MKRTLEHGDKDAETDAKQSKLTPVDGPADEPLDLDLDLNDAQLAASDEEDEFCVTLRLKDGPEVIVRPSNRRALVHEAIAEVVQKPAESIKVLQAGDQVEFGTTFEYNAIEHKATLSVLDNEEARIALEKIQNLGFKVCTYTEISQYQAPGSGGLSLFGGGQQQQLSLPDGKRYSPSLLRYAAACHTDCNSEQTWRSSSCYVPST